MYRLGLLQAMRVETRGGDDLSLYRDPPQLLLAITNGIAPESDGL
jgi:hypothetical protein